MSDWEENSPPAYKSGNRNSRYHDDDRGYAGNGRDRFDRGGYNQQDQRRDRNYDDRRGGRDGGGGDRRGGRDGGGDRRGGRDGGGGRSYDYNQQLDVRSDCIGMIIGRAGSNIQRIQSDYNVRVDIDKDTNVATVSGNSQGNIQDAMRHIRDQMDGAK